MNEPITAYERDILMKLETGNYFLKFSQLYRLENITMFPVGAAIGAMADRLRNKGLIEKRTISVNGVQIKVDVITNFGRKRLEQP